MLKKKITSYIQEIYDLPQSYVERIHYIENKNRITKLNTIQKPLREQFFTQLDRGGKEDAISSVHGRIKAILLTFPHYTDRNYDRPKNTLINLIQSLDHKVKIFIIITVKKEAVKSTAPSSDVVIQDLQELYQQCSEYDIQFYETPNFDNYSQWVRDPFMISNDSGNLATLIEPVVFWRNLNAPHKNYKQDRDLADRLVAYAPNNENDIQLEHDNSPLLFHGGNTLIGDEFILVGQDIFNLRKKEIRVLGRKEYTVCEIKSYFRKWLSPNSPKEVITVGARLWNMKKFRSPIKYEGKIYNANLLPVSKYQPFYHIDLFITPIGRPSYGAKYQLIMPEIVNASDVHSDLIYTQIIEPWNQQIATIADQLEQYDFEILYMKTPMTYFKNKTDELFWSVFSYNNCLVEIIGDGIRKIWIPSFGANQANYEVDNQIVYSKNLANYDKRTKTFLEGHFSKVIQLGNYTPYMLLKGGVHCLTNFLHRDTNHTV